MLSVTSFVLFAPLALFNLLFTNEISFHSMVVVFSKLLVVLNVS